MEKRLDIIIRAKDIDLDTGRINVDLDLLQQEIAEEKAQLAENHSILEFIDFGAKIIDRQILIELYISCIN